jgi:V8-like Glu-specific endopeptidase
MRSAVLLALSPLLGCIDPATPSLATHEAPVIGGSASPAGKWPDTAALLWGGYQECTGTLIAPTVVLTAAHCIEGYTGGIDLPDQVLVGGTSLSRRHQEGELISVTRGVMYPNAWTTVDAAILILAQPAQTPPRPVATGWPRLDIRNGAAVQLVGYGTTDRNGNVETDALMEAMTEITDFDCSTKLGCNVQARPAGELGAGGDGIDTCPGDSGGPAYLLTDYGAFVTGITSRGYNDNRYACSEGGIYGRPDKIIDWIEREAGVPVARGPEPAVEPITTTRGHAGETRIHANDPKQDAHHYDIEAPPGYGTARVRGDGLVRVCTDAGVVGDDAMVVRITDRNNPNRSMSVRIPIFIQDGDPAKDCDPDAFGDEGGCCDTRRSAHGSLPLALVIAFVLRRPRRRR